MRMRNILGPMLAGLASATVTASAWAQVDVEPPMPNVMILLDSSGSMMRRMNGDEANCGESGLNGANGVRWFALIDALTGSIPSLGCTDVDRSDPSFTATYGSNVPDVNYYIPFLRATSATCSLVPNPLYQDWDDTNATAWTDYPFDPNDIFGPTNAIIPSGACSEFAQNPDGVIDAYKRNVRFGLMTFDSLVDDEVGLGTGDVADVVTGQVGSWSYWNGTSSNWYDNRGGPSPHVGLPPACTTGSVVMEVGARSPAAPPWEGRLMGFGRDTASSDEVAANNTRIEQIIASMRPFGATPLAGMLSDFRDLAIRETRALPGLDGGPPRPLGSRDDTLWQLGNGCRPYHVILITDGEPNLDLRPDCTVDDPAADGVCPFDPIISDTFYTQGERLAETGIVNNLNTQYNIIFHVIGVAVGTNCNTAPYTTGGTRCDSSVTDRTDQEDTCCLLNAIEYVGNGEDPAHQFAHYATSDADLRAALTDILGDIASGTATRTTSVFSSIGPNFYRGTGGSTDPIAGHEITAALETTVGDGVWSGQLDRARFLCRTTGPSTVAVYTPPDASVGDSFHENIAVNPEDRFLITAVASPTPADSWKTLRPYLDAADPDQMGLVDADMVDATGDTFTTDTTIDAAMGTMVSGLCNQAFATTTGCSENVRRWYMGLPADSSLPDHLEKTRPSPLGGIYHSQPVLVGPPREFIRDEAYDRFAALYESRPTVAYVQSVDGQLHAFKVADNDEVNSDSLLIEDVTGTAKGEVEVDALENNELWSFVPPIVLGRLQPTYGRHALLLDGSIATANLPATRDPSDGAINTYLTGGRYRTYLVGSSGRASQVPGGGYYYGLDVSDPRPDTDDFDGSAVAYDTNPRRGSPRFLWQMSRTDATGDIDDADVRMFGDSVPAAALTTINYQGTEVAVAILAGGVSGSPPTSLTNSNYANNSSNGYPLNASSLTVRTQVRDWGATPRPDRSITIVRLDTGEILMRFVGTPDEATSGASSNIASSRVRVGNFLSPMSGTPVAYPGLPGQVSTRVFIGDADGFLWALDLSDPDPTAVGGGWKLQVAWDPYNSTTGFSMASDLATLGSIETVPIVSVDENANPIVMFATGTQEEFYSTQGRNFVVAIRGTPDADFTATPPTFETEYEQLWSLDLSSTTVFSGSAGQRVTGPLTLFDGVVYFATFVPDNDACTLGSSRVWGLDYDASAPTAVVNLDGAAGIEPFRTEAGTVFGVGIGQVPSCRSGVESDETDALYGGYRSFNTSNPGGFELVIQTGRPARQLDSNGNITAQDTVIQRESIPLTPPTPTVRIDSWAAIVE